MEKGAGVAGKSLQIPMQILLPVMAERRKEDWVGRDFVRREFWGLCPANGEPQKTVCLLKETSAGQEWQLESPYHAQLGQGERGLGLNTGGSRRCGSRRLSANHTPAGASLLQGDQAPLIAAPLPASSPRSYLSIFYFCHMASFDEKGLYTWTLINLSLFFIVCPSAFSGITVYSLVLRVFYIFS